MNHTTTVLIETLNLLTLKEDSKLRDQQYEISHTYNYGDPYWYIMHDGLIWNIDEVLPPSQNQLPTYDKAVEVLNGVLVRKIEEQLEYHKDLIFNPTEEKEPSPFPLQELQEIEIIYLSAKV